MDFTSSIASMNEGVGDARSTQIASLTKLTISGAVVLKVIEAACASRSNSSFSLRAALVEGAELVADNELRLEADSAAGPDGAWICPGISPVGFRGFDRDEVADPAMGPVSA